jgi:hypothetical protein
LNLKATQDKYSNIVSEVAFEAWQAAGDYIVPWVKADNKITKKFKTTYPSYCGSSQTRLTGTD